MCYSLGISLLLMPIIVQYSLWTGFVLAVLFAVGVFFTLLGVNQISALTLYGGLMAESERASALRPWDFRSRKRKDDRAMHDGASLLVPSTAQFHARSPPLFPCHVVLAH